MWRPWRGWRSHKRSPPSWSPTEIHEHPCSVLLQVAGESLGPEGFKARRVPNTQRSSNPTQLMYGKRFVEDSSKCVSVYFLQNLRKFCKKCKINLDLLPGKACCVVRVGCDIAVRSLKPMKRSVGDWLRSVREHDRCEKEPRCRWILAREKV